jgi:hypothetical protein
MYDDIRIIEWDFEPLHPARPDITGEVVYSKKWQKLMITPQMRIEQEVEGLKVKVDQWFVENEPKTFPILKVFPYHCPDARDTRVASNMICWMGSNAGGIYRQEARKLMEKGLEGPIAFLAAWSEMNIRQGMINRGRVPRDSLTASFDKAGIDPFNPLDFGTRATSVRDLETLEQVAMWLGGEAGQKFITSCERNIEIKYDREREEYRSTRLSVLGNTPA